jgi:demethylmenaquinone methyltransferase/2-methoxy-6-polyprenyl-1,4-benzoquinol methylase
MASKIYPESKVELNPFLARHYDRILNSISLGKYDRFIQRAISDMHIESNDQILDLGCGTGKNTSLMAAYLEEEGRITATDISPEMGKQFKDKHDSDTRINYKNQRIEIPFDLNKKFDKVFISFVIHGFPHEVRKQILKNVTQHLKPGGQLCILDFSEFEMSAMPRHHRFVFKKVECVYAFDFIEKDWKTILKDFGFREFTEKFYFRNYARLLIAKT